MEEKNEVVFSPRIIIDVIRKNLIFIIITTLVFSLGAFFITKFVIPKKYTSSVSLYVETKGESSESVNSASSLLSMHNYAQKLVATYIRMLDTGNCYQQLSEALGAKYTPAQLDAMISFKDDGATEVFDVYVVSGTPEEAKMVADVFAEIAPQIISDLNSNATLKIADSAQQPKSPSSPNTVKNVVIALVAGLVLSLIVSFVRYLIDKKIKYDEEMSEICGLPVLAAIPDFNEYTEKKK